MDDRVEPDQRILVDFAQVRPERGHVVEARSEVAAREEIGIEADDLVASVPQPWDEHGAYVAGVAGDQNFHRASIPNMALRQ